MSKFCGNCGYKLDDTARICGNCGVPCAKIAKHSFAQEIPGINYINPERKEKHRKYIKILVSILVLVIAVTAIGNFVWTRTGYRGVVRKIMNAYRDYDIDTLVDMTSDVSLYDFVIFDLESTVGNGLNTFETEIGHSYKFNYEITDVYVLSDYKTSGLIAALENEYSDFDPDMIQKFMMVEVEATAQAKKSTRSSTVNLQICLSKEDGTWWLFYISEN